MAAADRRVISYLPAAAATGGELALTLEGTVERRDMQTEVGSIWINLAAQMGSGSVSRLLKCQLDKTDEPRARVKSGIIVELRFGAN